MLTLRDRDQAGSRARLSKLPDPWTQRARPPVLGKPAENAGFPQLRQEFMSLIFQREPSGIRLIFTYRFC